MRKSRFTDGAGAARPKDPQRCARSIGRAWMSLVWLVLAGCPRGAGQGLTRSVPVPRHDAGGPVAHCRVSSDCHSIDLACDRGRCVWVSSRLQPLSRDLVDKKMRELEQ
jgi:hypothetical protein